MHPKGRDSSRMQLLRDMKKFVGFEAEDAERLGDLYPVVDPHAEEVVDDFCDVLRSNTQRLDVFEDDEELERLREAFREWVMAGFEGSYGTDYGEAQRRLGARFEELGVAPEYLLGAINIVRCDFVEILADADLEVPLRDAIVSVERIIDLNSALMLDTYWHTTIEKRGPVGAELASFMAHEIRNPLNAVELNMTLLQRRLAETYDDPDEYLPMLEAVRSELNRIEELTQEIKQFAQPISVAAGWHDLPELIAELEASHAALFEAADIQFDIEIDEGAHVYCDADRFKQLVVNLLKNSVEAIDESGEVVLSAESTPNHTELSVVDSGEGIDPDSTRRFFELFYTTKSSGTGLGLPVAKKIVDAHGGSIDLRPNEFGGTTVDVVLPAPEESGGGEAAH